MCKNYLSIYKWFHRHFLLCVYGTVAIGLILAGQVKEFKVIYILKGNLDFSMTSLVGWAMHERLNMNIYFLQLIMGLKIHSGVWLRMLYRWAHSCKSEVLFCIVRPFACSCGYDLSLEKIKWFFSMLGRVSKLSFMSVNIAWFCMPFWFGCGSRK